MSLVITASASSLVDVLATDGMGASTFLNNGVSALDGTNTATGSPTPTETQLAISTRVVAPDTLTYTINTGQTISFLNVNNDAGMIWDVTNAQTIDITECEITMPAGVAFPMTFVKCYDRNLAEIPNTSLVVTSLSGGVLTPLTLGTSAFAQTSLLAAPFAGSGTTDLGDSSTVVDTVSLRVTFTGAVAGSFKKIVVGTMLTPGSSTVTNANAVINVAWKINAATVDTSSLTMSVVPGQVVVGVDVLPGSAVNSSYTKLFLGQALLVEAQPTQTNIVSNSLQFLKIGTVATTMSGSNDGIRVTTENAAATSMITFERGTDSASIGMTQSDEISLFSQKITNLASGTNATDAVNMSQLNSVNTALLSVMVFTTDNSISIPTPPAVVDGVLLQENMTVLVARHSTVSLRGLYIVTSGNLIAVPNSFVVGQLVHVTMGSQSGSIWKQIGTTETTQDFETWILPEYNYGLTVPVFAFTNTDVPNLAVGADWMLDGVYIPTTHRVLLNGQSTGIDRGIYTYDGSALTANPPGNNIVGSLVRIMFGNNYGGAFFQATENGTSSLTSPTWVQVYQPPSKQATEFTVSAHIDVDIPNPAALSTMVYDGTTISNGELVLLTNQTTNANNNGLWTVGAATDLINQYASFQNTASIQGITANVVRGNIWAGRSLMQLTDTAPKASNQIWVSLSPTRSVNPSTFLTVDCVCDVVDFDLAATYPNEQTFDGVSDVTVLFMFQNTNPNQNGIYRYSASNTYDRFLLTNNNNAANTHIHVTYGNVYGGSNWVVNDDVYIDADPVVPVTIVKVSDASRPSVQVSAADNWCDLLVTDPITLTAIPTTIDGVTGITGLRICLINQTNSIDNGIYYVSAPNSASRVVWTFGDVVLSNSRVHVRSGHRYTGALLMQTLPEARVDYTDLNIAIDMPSAYTLGHRVYEAPITLINTSFQAGFPSTPVSVDGVVLSNGIRVLLANQGSDTGVYIVSGSNYVRDTAYMPTGDYICPGTLFHVTSGVQYANSRWTVQGIIPVLVANMSLLCLSNYTENGLLFTSVDAVSDNATGTVPTSDIVDGVIIGTNRSALFPFFSSPALRGIYTWNGTAFVKNILFPTNTSMLGATVTVSGGATYGNTVWNQSENVYEGSVSPQAWNQVTEQPPTTRVFATSNDAPIVAASTVDINLNEASLDGVSLTNGDKVLVWNQTLGWQNGVYTVAPGSWTRDTNMTVVSYGGTMFRIASGGTTYGNSLIVQQTPFAAIGTQDIQFELMTTVGSVSVAANNGLELSAANVISTRLGTTLEVVAADLRVKTDANFTGTDAFTGNVTLGDGTSSIIAVDAASVSIEAKTTTAELKSNSGTTVDSTTGTTTISGPAATLTATNTATVSGTNTNVTASNIATLSGPTTNVTASTIATLSGPTANVTATTSSAITAPAISITGANTVSVSSAAADVTGTTSSIMYSPLTTITGTTTLGLVGATVNMTATTANLTGTTTATLSGATTNVTATGTATVGGSVVYLSGSTSAQVDSPATTISGTNTAHVTGAATTVTGTATSVITAPATTVTGSTTLGLNGAAVTVTSTTANITATGTATMSGATTNITATGTITASGATADVTGTTASTVSAPVVNLTGTTSAGVTAAATTITGNNTAVLTSNAATVSGTATVAVTAPSTTVTGTNTLTLNGGAINNTSSTGDFTVVADSGNIDFTTTTGRVRAWCAAGLLDLKCNTATLSGTNTITLSTTNRMSIESTAQDVVITGATDVKIQSTATLTLSSTGLASITSTTNEVKLQGTTGVRILSPLIHAPVRTMWTPVLSSASGAYSTAFDGTATVYWREFNTIYFVASLLVADVTGHTGYVTLNLPVPSLDVGMTAAVLGHAVCIKYDNMIGVTGTITGFIGSNYTSMEFVMGNSTTCVTVDATNLATNFTLYLYGQYSVASIA